MEEEKKVVESTSWGDIAEYQAAWKKFKAEKGGEAADAMEFIDAWCEKHPDMNNEDDRNGMFADISAMEEKDESLTEDKEEEVEDIDVEKIKDVFIHHINWDAAADDVDFAEDDASNLVLNGYLNDNEYDYLMSNWEDLYFECEEEINKLVSDGYYDDMYESLKEDSNSKQDIMNIAKRKGYKIHSITNDCVLNYSDGSVGYKSLEGKNLKDLKNLVNDLPDIKESLKEDSKEEAKLETFDEQMDFLASDEQEAIDGYEKVLALVEDEHVKEQLEKILVEEKAHKEFLEKVKEDKTLEYSHEEHEEEKKEDEVKDENPLDNFDNGEDIMLATEIDLDDVDDDFGESLEEDTVKKGNKWVNRGDDGEHGEFKTKKEADAQRKAMFANGYHESVEEDVDDDFGFNHVLDEEAEELGVTVDWNAIDEDVEIKEEKIEEASHDTGHIKAKKPIELKARVEK